MQAPAAPDEDRRGGFDHGGWATANADAVLGEAMAPPGASAGESVLLMGRRTYEDLAAAALELVDSVTTTTGVIIATYRSR